MSTLSIVCIDTIHHERAEQAVLQTWECLNHTQQPVQCVYWLSDQMFSMAGRLPIIHHPISKIENFPYDYNYHCLHTLPWLIQEDHVLVVQWDGYAVNSQAWTQEFLCYDYIGAVWPSSLAPVHSSVGNGGFSLRSKRLLNCLKNLQIDYNYPEDNTICIHQRHVLQTQGIVFAPENLAHQFSIEQCWNNSWFTKSFGFHGLNALAHYPRQP